MNRLLSINGVKKYYKRSQLFSKMKYLKAVDGVSFHLHKKETIAIVGESGCGKSTLARLIMGIEPPTEGVCSVYDNQPIDISTLTKKELSKYIQIVFQDPYSSINPRKKVWQIISEPLIVNSDMTSTQCQDTSIEMMEKVGLGEEYKNRYPHMLSGGQRQRVGIARALMLNPKMLVCDEPVSALDVSIQAQVLNLLMDLQDSMGLSYIFISHDLSVVRHIADVVIVMYLGKVVEHGKVDDVFSNPLHPYTKLLMSSSPQITKNNLKKGSVFQTELPSAFDPPSGCSFHPRCPLATDTCKTTTPELRLFKQKASCHNIISH